jgi:hypothetical protein
MSGLEVNLDITRPSDLLQQQQDKCGISYAYCSSCFFAVSRKTVWRAKKFGRQLLCRRCGAARGRASMSARKPATIWLCSVCRVPIVGRKETHRAANAARRGVNYGCSEECRGKLRSDAARKAGWIARDKLTTEQRRANALRGWSKVRK